MNYVEREQAILDIAHGRKVLHLGCVVFTDLEARDRVQLTERSLHWSLGQVADVFGIDYSETVINEYRRLGVFTNIVGNIERLNELDVKGKFDLILAGEII
jgi:hypothetical protein